MRRALVIAVALSASVVTGFAASLAVTGDSVAAGNASVVGCGSTASASVAYSVVGASVVSVRVSGLPAPCAGAALRATVVDGTNAALASGGPVVVAADGSATLPLSSGVSPSAIAATEFVAVGP